jgi:farnesyl-diphosphate farnesyltransferase
LQLVNILRDIPADLAQGRCYMPSERLAASGLSPIDLLKPDNDKLFRKVHGHYIQLARSHLAAGWSYTQSLPRSSVRVRLACAWPILFGARTLKRLEQHNVLDPKQRIKIRRAEVRSLIVRSILYYPSAERWRRLFHEETPPSQL